MSGEDVFLREIALLGVRLLVMAPGGCWRGPFHLIQNLNPDGYELQVRNCLFTPIDSVRLRTHIYYYPQISGVMEARKWDLVHIIEEPCNFATYQIVRESCKRRKRVVFTSFKNAVQEYPFPFNLLERYVHGAATGAVAGSMDALSALRAKGFAKPSVCIHGGGMGVDPLTFQKSDAGDLREMTGFKDAFLIGFVGQITYRKGLETLIKALALLPQKCALILVGTGPDLAKLRGLVQELGLSARVRWEAWVDRKEIPRYLCAFDALVLPSRTLPRWREDFGRVLIEAMACETPVVGSDSGEIPNVIGDAGLVFHEGNEQELAGHLLRLLQNPSIGKELGRRGRERVLERFTYAKVAEQTVEFYKRICNDNNECQQL